MFFLGHRTYMNNNKNFKLNIYSGTHNGRVRINNEDNYFVNGFIKENKLNITTYNASIDNSDLLAVVCDGMGGEANGEIASLISVENCKQLYNDLLSASVEEIGTVVNNYTSSTNDKICQMLENNKCSRGGSTFAMVYIRNNVVYTFSLGDSRVYLYRDKQIFQISQDHTLAMRKYKANIYTKEEAEKSVDSHKLTLFLGVDYNSKGLNAEAYQPFELKPGDKLLLCSDGLYDMCSKNEISDIFDMDGKDYSKLLVEKALQNGGIDNTTSIVIECNAENVDAVKSSPKISRSNIKLESVQNNNYEKQNQAPEKNEENFKKRYYIMIIIAFVMIIILGALLFALLLSSDKHNVENKESNIQASSKVSTNTETEKKTNVQRSFLSDDVVESEKTEENFTFDSIDDENSNEEADIMHFGNFEYVLNDDNEVIITKYLGDEREVEVQGVIDGKKVAKIDIRSFMDNTNLEKIKIADTITDIGEGAFMNCESLKEITFSDNISEIRHETFKNCKSLEAIDFSKNQLRSIGDEAFWGCTALHIAKVPKTLRHIGTKAFIGSKLNQITLSHDCQFVSNNTFPINCKINYFEDLTLAEYIYT